MPVAQGEHSGRQDCKRSEDTVQQRIVTVFAAVPVAVRSTRLSPAESDQHFSIRVPARLARLRGLC
eukprot:768616-Hanusia_phi.AAC.1